MENNNVIKRGKVSNIFVLGRIIVGLVVCFIFLFILFLFMVAVGNSTIFIFIGSIVVILEICEALASTKSVMLEVSENRISGKRGVFKIVELDCPIDKITQIKVEQTLFGKIFDYGNIVITTASATFDFKHIKDADGFRDVVNNQLEKCSK